MPRKTRRKTTIRPVVLVAALTVLALTVPALTPAARATSYVRMDDGDLVDRSPYIVRGQVVAVESASDGLPAVDYQLAVERWLKGALPATDLIVRVPGGVRPDGLGLQIRGMPVFRVGEEGLFFLVARPDGAFGLFQYMLGAFHIVDDGPQSYAVRRLDGAGEVTLPGRALPRDGLRDLAAFVRWIEDRAAGRSRGWDYFVADGPGLGPGGGASAASERFRLITSLEEPLPVGCGESGGHPVRWFDFDEGRPVFWRTHKGGQPGLDGGGSFDFRLGLQSWDEDPHTTIDYFFGGETSSTNGLQAPDGINALIFEDPNDEIGGSFLDSGILAMGGPWFLCDLRREGRRSFHPVVEGDIITQDGVVEYFQRLATDPTSAARELFAHELGHTLGLDHPPKPDALMFSLIHDDGRGAALNVDDLAGIFLLYGASNAPEVPGRPQDLSARAEDFQSIRLGWIRADTRASNFRIERRDGDGEFRLVGVAPSQAAAFLDTGLDAESSYTYRIFAQNAAGRSDGSDEAGATTPEDRRPLPPTNLWAAPLDASSVRLSWQDNSEFEGHYLVSIRRTQQFLLIRYPVPANSTRVEIIGLSPDHLYGFRIQAVNQDGTSEWSNVATARTFDPDPTCTVTRQRLCLGDGRFAVEARYRLPGAAESEPARAVPGTTDAGSFWFFDPGNLELHVQLNELEENGKGVFEVAYADLSTLEYEIEVTDTQTGTEQVYGRPAGELCGGRDLGTFAAMAPARPRLPKGRSAPGVITFEADPAVRQAGTESVPRSHDPGGSSPTCISGPESLCLGEGRFDVTAVRIDPADGSEIPGQVSARARTTGFFYFQDPEKVEALVKVLDARDLTGSFWVFYSGLADHEIRITVTDRDTGRVRDYVLPAGDVCGGFDLDSFTDEPE